MSERHPIHKKSIWFIVGREKLDAEQIIEACIVWRFGGIMLEFPLWLADGPPPYTVPDDLYPKSSALAAILGKVREAGILVGAQMPLHEPRGDSWGQHVQAMAALYRALGFEFVYFDGAERVTESGLPLEAVPVICGWFLTAIGPENAPKMIQSSVGNPINSLVTAEGDRDFGWRSDPVREATWTAQDAVIHCEQYGTQPRLGWVSDSIIGTGPSYTQNLVRPFTPAELFHVWGTAYAFGAPVTWRASLSHMLALGYGEDVLNPIRHMETRCREQMDPDYAVTLREPPERLFRAGGPWGLVYMPTVPEVFPVYEVPYPVRGREGLHMFAAIAIDQWCVSSWTDGESLGLTVEHGPVPAQSMAVGPAVSRTYFPGTVSLRDLVVALRFAVVESK